MEKNKPQTAKVQDPKTSQGKAETKKVEPKVEAKAQACPAGACQELQDIWAKGGGCYDATSKFCKSCSKDFPEAKSVCEARTQVQVQAKADKKVAKSVARKRGNANEFGHGNDTQAGLLDTMLKAGTALDKMVEKVLPISGRTKEITRSRIMTHVAHLKKDHGVKISTEGGVYKIMTDAEAKAAEKKAPEKKVAAAK